MIPEGARVGVGEGEGDEAGFLAALAGIVGGAHVLTGDEATAPFVRDWRGRYQGRARAVVCPASVDEVSQVMALCAAHAVPVVPQGGNTGLCGGATPDGAGRDLVLVLSRLKRVRERDVANNTLTVEAGCTLAEVQALAEGMERLFPLTLASQGTCEIGGNISTNAGGVQVLRYGNMRDLVLGLEVVLPDGRIWDGLRGLRKDNTGYDLKHLFIGAEGTLGVVTAAVLKLFPLPRARLTAWASVASPEYALKLLTALQQGCGEQLTAFELVSAEALALVVKHVPGSRPPLQAPRGRGWHVLFELSCEQDEAGARVHLEQVLAGCLSEGWLDDVVVASSIAQARALWALRENISEAQRIEGFSIKHDVSVPVSRVPRFLGLAGQRLQARWPDVRIVAFGHLGDGNLHYNLSKADQLDNDAFIARTAEANRIVHDLVAELGGSISAEHGLGQLKREEIRLYKSEVELDLMRSIKCALDPLGLMNPGKVI